MDVLQRPVQGVPRLSPNYRTYRRIKWVYKMDGWMDGCFAADTQTTKGRTKLSYNLILRLKIRTNNIFKASYSTLKMTHSSTMNKVLLSFWLNNFHPLDVKSSNVLMKQLQKKLNPAECICRHKCLITRIHYNCHYHHSNGLINDTFHPNIFHTTRLNTSGCSGRNLAENESTRV